MERFGSASPALAQNRWGLQRMSEETFTTKVMPGFGLGLLMAAAGAYLGQGLPFAFCMAAMLGEFLLVLSSGLWMRKAGLNTTLYFVVTLLAGMATVPLLAWASIRGGPMIVAQALGTTTAVFMVLGAVGFTMKRSLANWGGVLFAGGLALILGSLVGVFLFPHSTPFHIGISVVGALFFAAFVVYDFQQIRQSYGDDDWMGASLALFLDFMGLFTTILRLMGFMATPSSND